LRRSIVVLYSLVAGSIVDTTEQTVPEKGRGWERRGEERRGESSERTTRTRASSSSSGGPRSASEHRRRGE